MINDPSSIEFTSHPFYSDLLQIALSPGNTTLLLLKQKLQAKNDFLEAQNGSFFLHFVQIEAAKEELNYFLFEDFLQKINANFHLDPQKYNFLMKSIENLAGNNEEVDYSILLADFLKQNQAKFLLQPPNISISPHRIQNLCLEDPKNSNFFLHLIEELTQKKGSKGSNIFFEYFSHNLKFELDSRMRGRNYFSERELFHLAEVVVGGLYELHSRGKIYGNMGLKALVRDQDGRIRIIPKGYFGLDGEWKEESIENKPDKQNNFCLDGGREGLYDEKDGLNGRKTILFDEKSNEFLRKGQFSEEKALKCKKKGYISKQKENNQKVQDEKEISLNKIDYLYPEKQVIIRKNPDSLIEKLQTKGFNDSLSDKEQTEQIARREIYQAGLMILEAATFFSVSSCLDMNEEGNHEFINRKLDIVESRYSTELMFLIKCMLLEKSITARDLVLLSNKLFGREKEGSLNLKVCSCCIRRMRRKFEKEEKEEDEEEEQGEEQGEKEREDEDEEDEIEDKEEMNLSIKSIIIL